MNFLHPGHLFLSQTLHESRAMPKLGITKDSQLPTFGHRTADIQDDNIKDEIHRGDSNALHSTHCIAPNGSYIDSAYLTFAFADRKFNANERANNRHIQSTNLRRLRLHHTYFTQRDTGHQELQHWQSLIMGLELRHGREGKQKSTVIGCTLSRSIGN
jgi:hypothetical protein